MVRYPSNQDISLIALLRGRVVFEITGIENIAKNCDCQVLHFKNKIEKVVVTAVDQKLRELRTLKQHYYPEVILL